MMVMARWWYRGVLAALPASARILTRSLIYMEPWRATIVSLGGIHTLLDVRCKTVKGLLDVDVVLRGHLQEGNAKLISQLLALLGGDGPLLLPVALVSDQDLVNALAGVLLDVGKPGSDVYSRWSDLLRWGG
jgi:hypothetical protein